MTDLPTSGDSKWIDQQRQQFKTLCRQRRNLFRTFDPTSDVDISERRRELRDEMVEVLQEIVSHRTNTDATYKQQMLELLTLLRDDISSWMLAEAVGCSVSHAEQFMWDSEAEEARLRDWAEREAENRASHRKTRTIKRRDNHECVRCRDSSRLRVHHIIPVGRDGSDCDENLATLCTDCHDEAHGGATNSSYTIYNDREGFWEWVEDGRTTRQTSISDW